MSVLWAEGSPILCLASYQFTKVHRLPVSIFASSINTMINQDLPYNEESMWDDKDQAEQIETKSRRSEIHLLGIPEKEKER